MSLRLSPGCPFGADIWRSSPVWAGSVPPWWLWGDCLLPGSEVFLDSSLITAMGFCLGRCSWVLGGTQSHLGEGISVYPLAG